MPRGDGTGPAGLGPMTGRAAGYCAGFPVPGFMNPSVWGGGYGRRGAGGGRGRRNWYYATGMPGRARAAQGMPAWGMAPGAYPPPAFAPYGPYEPSAEEELEMLQEQSEMLSEQIEQIKKRMDELQKEKEKAE